MARLSATTATSINGGVLSYSLVLYNSSTGQLLRRIAAPEHVLGPLLFSRDGNRLAGVTGNGNAITIWDVQTGLKLVTLDDASPTIDSMAFSPDGTRLIPFRPMTAMSNYGIPQRERN